MELLIDIQEDHTALRFVENEEAEFYVPMGWNGSYYPAEIPEGFVLEEISEFANEATFMNENGEFIYFGEYIEGDMKTAIVVRLQRESSTGSWTTIIAWNSSDEGKSEAGGTKALKSGYNYRVYVTGRVYDSAGTLVETVNKYSQTKAY